MLQTLNTIDLHISRLFRIQKNHRLWWPAVILAHSGDSWVWATAVGLVWLLTFGKGYWHAYSATLEISIVCQALFVFGLKSLIRRQRPSGEWGGIYRSVDPHSFPSGHATRAVLLAVLGIGLGPAWFGWLMALWAPLVCASRVLTGLHYFSDILGGILLGLLLGLLVLAIYPLWMAWFPFFF